MLADHLDVSPYDTVRPLYNTPRKQQRFLPRPKRFEVKRNISELVYMNTDASLAYIILYSAQKIFGRS
jgi:ABC-type lipoprotein release transport system permease subunit